MKLVEPKDMKAGDRIWCRAWRHPMLILARDEDEDGPWFKVRRWDGMVLPGRFRFGPATLRSTGPLHLVDPSESCPHCGRLGEDAVVPEFARAKVFPGREGDQVVEITFGDRRKRFVVPMDQLERLARAFHVVVQERLTKVGEAMKRLRA